MLKNPSITFKFFTNFSKEVNLPTVGSEQNKVSVKTYKPEGLKC